jgi:cold shock CspA family protein
MKGVIICFLERRGIGFIEADTTGEKLFFHISDRGHEWTAIRLGSRVSFAVSFGRETGDCRRALMC